jgi:predicted ester cyclase
MPAALGMLDRLLSKRGLLTAAALSAAAVAVRRLGMTKVAMPTIEENKAVVRHLIEDVFNTGDAKDLDRLTGPNLAADVRQGLFGVMRVAFPDLKYSIERLVAESDLVVFQVMGHGTHQGRLTHPAGTVDIAPTGKRIEWREVHVVRIENGRAVDEKGALDVLGMVYQLGAKIALPN